MVTIIFEAHGTTLDNEMGLSSGWYDVELSELGKRQARQLGGRYQDEHLDTIFCSDLRRSYATAEIAFANRHIPVVKNSRLREVNYGDLTRHSDKDVEEKRSSYISSPFPNGESYEDTNRRMKEFLEVLLKSYNGKKVMIIGHRVTQYALECFLNGKTLHEAVTAPWQWQPGWTYYLKKI